jgi:hypothetical protein
VRSSLFLVSDDQQQDDEEQYGDDEGISRTTTSMVGERAQLISGLLLKWPLLFSVLVPF